MNEHHQNCGNNDEAGKVEIALGSTLDTEICFAVGGLCRDQLERTALELPDVDFDERTSDDELRARVIDSARESGGIVIYDSDGDLKRFGFQADRKLAPMQSAMQQLEGAFGVEHPEFTREEHSREVNCGDTRLWEYWEWVVHQVEGANMTVAQSIEQARKVVETQKPLRLAEYIDGFDGLVLIPAPENLFDSLQATDELLPSDFHEAVRLLSRPYLEISQDALAKIESLTQGHGDVVIFWGVKATWGNCDGGKFALMPLADSLNQQRVEVQATRKLVEARLPQALLNAAVAKGLIVEDGEVLWSSDQGVFSLDHWLTAKHGDIRINLRMWNRDDPDVPVIEHSLSSPVSLEHALGLIMAWGEQQAAIVNAAEKRRHIQNVDTKYSANAI